MLEQLSEIFIHMVDQFGFIGIFIASTAESFFIPIPAEVIAFTAGYYARSSDNLWMLAFMIIITTLGNYVGAAVFFAACRRGARAFLPKFIDRWGPFLLISHEEVEKAENLFAKHGKKMVFFSKFIPVVKNLIDFPAGLSKMPFAEYTIYTIAGSLIRNAIFCFIGYFIYEAKDQIFTFMKPVEKLVLVALVVLGIVYILKVIFRIRQLSIERKSIEELGEATL